MTHVHGRLGRLRGAGKDLAGAGPRSTGKRLVGATAFVALAALTAALAGSSSPSHLSSADAAIRPAAAAAAPGVTTPPTVSGTAQVGQTLTGNPGSWSNNPTSFTYSWFRCDSVNTSNCATISGASGTNYTLTTDDLGKKIKFHVAASNGDGTTAIDSALTAEVIAAPAAPSNTSPPTISGTAQVGQTLTGDHGTWANNPTDYNYTWLRCDSNGNNCNPISGASNSTYTLTGDDLGHRIRFRVQANNGNGSSTVDSGPTNQVAGSYPAPANTSLPTITGTAQVGQTLTGNRGNWSNNPTDFNYTWLRCDGNGNSCGSISNAHGGTYTLTSDDLGHRIRFQVQANSAHGHTVATSDPTATVAAAMARPANASPPTVSGIAQVGQVLTGNPGTWSNNPSSFAYSWLRCDGNGNNCAAIPGATGTTWRITAASAGHRLRFHVQASNSGGGSTADSAPTQPVGSSTGLPTPAGTIAINNVSLPDRLVIDKIRWNPARIQSPGQTITARFHVSETAHGMSVSGAYVYAIGVPFNRLSAPGEVATGNDGWAQVSFQVLPTFQLRRGNYVVVFVRARKPGENVLAGVSTRRLVSIQVG